ncbi:DUF6907 domain-containing protein [Nonomuraea guangzhouensis]|uniref:DUF6907 domain-containing protein n=1 Tax=Nonomuraea guangzhouensis TaxID=1291555 RepID=A0ABW4GYY7_9ACTN|nr:hypothetical protein [Nonomuraea guangzhouensis]
MASTNKEKAGLVSDHLTRPTSQPLQHQEETLSNTTIPQPNCKPWCVQHDPDGDICIAENVEAGDHTVGLSFQADEGVQVHVDRFDGTVPLAEGGHLANAILAQIARTHPAPPSVEIPPRVAKAAADAGGRVIDTYVREWHAEIKAHENYVTSRAAGTAEPAAWLAEDPCDVWCVDGVDHTPGTHPDDRAHFSHSVLVPLKTMAPIVVSYPERWEPPQLALSLERKYREKEPRVVFQVGDETVAWSTLTEAENIAHALLGLIAAAQGLEWGKVVPLQHEPKACDDSTCMCHEQLFAPTCGS